MADNTYVLDLLVTGAEVVSVNDDGSGNDTIRVTGVYAATIDIHLAWTVVSGTPLKAGSRYYSADNSSHQLVVHGLIENAFGSNGTETITGNDVGNLLAGDQQRTGAGRSDTIWGGGGDDLVYGGAGDDDLYGEADSDRLYGDAGNDTIQAGAGSDTVEGGAGADWLAGGGDLGDTLSYAASRLGVTVTLRAVLQTLGHGGDAEGDRISGFANVIGSAGRDRITMSDNSSLPTEASDNILQGGRGSDRLAAGIGNDLLAGGSGRDVIFGDAGDDSLFGDTGQDRLIGGAGQDWLTGGAGADRFVFLRPGDSPLANPDTVTDFSPTEGDRIDLSRIDADSTRPGNQAFHLVAPGFNNHPAELRIEARGADIAVLCDVNGDATADVVLLVLNHATLALTDFLL